MFEQFDHYKLPIGADGTPYEYLEQLRDYAVERDVQIDRSDQHGGYWIVVGYDAAREIHQSPDSFGNSQSTLPLYATPGGRPIMWAAMDEPDHSKYLRVVQSPFSPPRVAKLAETLRETTNDLIDAFIDDGRVDVAQNMANEVPVRMIAILLGMPPEQGSSYRGWTHAMANFHSGHAGAEEEMSRMDAYFHDLLAARRADPGEDVFSSLVEAEVDGRPMTETEIYDAWVMLLIGGIDNTAYLLSNSIWRLSWDLELRRRLIANPDLLPLAIEEFLRYYGPAMSLRVVREPITVGGVEMAPGELLMNVLPVINRDPRQFDNPDVFIPDRSPNRHFALGLGIHRCLGNHLVKVEMRVALEELLRRIPEFELDHDRRHRWVQGQVAGIDSVPIVFPAGGREARELREPVPVG